MKNAEGGGGSRAGGYPQGVLYQMPSVRCAKVGLGIAWPMFVFPLFWFSSVPTYPNLWNVRARSSGSRQDRDDVSSRKRLPYVGDGR